MREALCQQHLAGRRDRAQAGRQVERAAAEAVTDRYRLAGVEADADPQRQRVVRLHPLDEALLKRDRCADRLARRSEHDQRLVASQLDQPSAQLLDRQPDGVGERARQSGGRLIASLLCVARVAAHIGNQERPDLGLVAPAWREL